MILVAGGTGHLGRELVPLLIDGGNAVRVLTRDRGRAHERLGARVDLALGDARNPETLPDALKGVDMVVSAITGFGPGAAGPRAVDYLGNINLIAAAERAAVGRFVLISMNGAAAQHPMELMRQKHRAEEALKASRLDWVVVQPNVFLELWVDIVGGPIARDGKAMVLGRGNNPINFNSARDVARFVELALFDPSLSRKTIAVGGPDNVTMNQLVGRIERATGRQADVRHAPIPVMRLASLVLRPVRPDLSGMIEAGISLDTADMAFDAAELRKRFPQLELTPVDDVVSRLFTSRDAAIQVN